MSRLRIHAPAVLVCAAVTAVILFLHTPLVVATPRLVSVPEGSTLAETTALFEREGLVTSSFLLRAFVTLVGGDEKIQAGEYLFDHPQGTAQIALRLVKGDYQITPVRVLIPEGTSVAEMAVIFETHLFGFDTDAFIERAGIAEGYLFPDTYLLPPNASVDTVITTLSDTFTAKVAPLQEGVAASGHTLHDILTMASILEEEAQTTHDRQVIAGILWKRLELGMALQVDAPFGYLLGKTSAELTDADLAFDSSYNTYTNRGLPPGPITNPGLDALQSALTPIETPYLFYLSDETGSMHYAATFDEHKQNKGLYLR